ncbi:MAG: phosphatidylglycerophosphatase A [Bacilli bacterium]|nr:phosphatidylglycerophosphatase A [Bacilli bacterium]
MEHYDLAIKKLKERGVTINDIAEVTLFLQTKYVKGLTLDHCIEEVKNVIKKRESINAILTGISIDEMTEKKLIDKELCDIIMDDEGLYGIDEILALSIVNVHGSIALTNFGYADKIKPGIVKIVDNDGHNGNKCNTFLDDIVCAIAASAASRIAHYGIEKK